jgi:hypothetical protein
MLQHFAAGTRRAVAVDADDGAAIADEALPAQCGAGLDGDARGPDRAEHPFAIGVIPLGEEFPRGHADDPSAQAVRGK